MAATRSLLLVHGAWGGGWHWDPVVEPLRDRGFGVGVVERLPSAGSDPAELGDLAADAEHVRAWLDDAEGPVVLCGFSYGGMVITEVADHPAIGDSVYLAAFWPPKGQSVLDFAGEEGLPPWIVLRDDGTLAITEDLELARQALAGDLDVDQAASLRRRCVLQSAASYATPSTAPDRTHPVTYVICTEDQAIPAPAQEAMAAGADRTVRLASAHFAQFSRTGEVVDVLASVASGVEKTSSAA